MAKKLVVSVLLTFLFSAFGLFYISKKAGFGMLSAWIAVRVLGISATGSWSTALIVANEAIHIGSIVLGVVLILYADQVRKEKKNNNTVTTQNAALDSNIIPFPIQKAN